MPFLILLAEFGAFFWLASKYGFFNVMFWYFLPTLIGLLILSRAPRMIPQTTPQTLQNLASMIAGVLLLPPLLTSRLLAICILIPGVRTLTFMVLHGWLTSKFVNRQGVWVFSSNSRGGFEPRTRDVTPTPFSSSEQILDVTPLRVVREEGKRDGTEPSRDTTT